MITGIMDETDIMLAYSWISFGALFYTEGATYTYVYSIHDIIDCAISNDVQDSYYANRTFFDYTWKRA